MLRSFVHRTSAAPVLRAKGLRPLSSAAPVRWILSCLTLVVCYLAAASGAFAQSAACQVTYTKSWEGGNGFGANIAIMNTGPAITNGWTLTFTFTNGERVQNGWPVTFSQPAGSAQVTVSSNASWNQSIGSGATFTAGFNGTFTSTVGTPTGFTLNGTACTGGGTGNTPPTISLSSPTSGQTFPAGSAVTLAATASDPGGAVSRVEFRVDGSLVGTDTSSPYSFNATGLANGSHTAQATAFDNGTPSLSTATAAVPFTIGGTSTLSITATPTSLQLPGGTTGTSSIRLGASPASPVTVTITRTGSTAITHSPTSVTLNSSNWNTGVNVTFTAAAGTATATSTFTAAATGYTSATITVSRSTSSGGAVFRVDPTGRITKNGQAFPVRCGSWFGLEGRHEPSDDPINPSGAPMELYIGNTSWANGNAGTGRTIQQTMTEITGMGINVVRLPVVPQTLDANNPQGRDPYLKNHSSVRVANSRLALEQFIVAADQNNIEVMLDVHSCSNYVGWRKGRLDARPPWVDATRENYDYTRENYSCAASGNPSTVTTTHPYNQATWLDNLRTLAGLGTQLGVDNIIGIDIYNEPHDYTWAEWKALTEAAYTAINSVNPNTLLFVQGIGTVAGTQDGTPTSTTAVPHGAAASNPNWGENLFEAGTNPINIPKERLVFSPHTYGPSVFVQRMFMDPAQPQCAGLEGDEAGDANCNIVINPTQLRAGWEEHFGYLRDQGYAVVVGEFGGNLDWPLGQASIRDRDRWSHITPGVDAQWQDAFVDYMVSKNIEGCYWSINPESGDTAGWYGHAYDPISNTAGWGQWQNFDQRKTNLLNRLWGR
ncbi:MAG TPA: cellulase family glycosylhydrolase [Steroidobacter sp.]|uniref:cellulase family glycosylhydrolase n=1 Tax=Steroidobacter sp. TaxID=1978227 RepID=UPI002EDB3BA9